MLVDTTLLQGLLNLCFEDPKKPEAVICVDASDSEHPRIYSAVPHA
ncbi:MAG TPA: hypothetical protein VHS96_13885 [Bacteroidia bacterium]|nr:hypothetical protein [Bacteroidia bacterium]